MTEGALHDEFRDLGRWDSDRLRPLRSRAIDIPTLVIAGGASPDFFRDTAATVAGLLPNGKYMVLEGPDHGAPPDVAAPVVAEFLSTSPVEAR